MAEQVGTKLSQTAAKLATLRDTVELKLNLASKDAKDTWELLKDPIGDQLSQLDTLAKKVESTSDEAKLQAYLGYQELSEKLEFFSDNIDRFITDINEKADQVGEQIELTALKAEIAKLDADDYIETKKAEFTKNFKASKDAAVSGIHSIIDRTSNRLDDLIKKIGH